MLKKDTKIQKTAIAGLMLALSLVIARIITIEVPLGGATGLIITLSSIPIAYCAIVLGPYYGMMVSVSYDILKILLISGKNYDYVFSFSAAVYGCIVGFAFLNSARKPSFVKLYVVLLLAEFFQSTLLNTFFIVTRYGLNFYTLIPMRLFSLAINPVITAYMCRLMFNVSEKANVISYIE